MRFRDQLLVALATGLLMGATATRAQTVYYVDDDGAPGNGCTSWLDACPDLQTALGLAVSGDQIWVAAGTYRPHDCNPTCDRTATFQLMTGVALYGGFDGSETMLAQRAGLFDQTTLSGDIDGDDAAVACVDSPDCDSHGGICVEGFCIIKENNDENSYSVVTGTDTDTTAVLDGFTVTGGNANDVSVYISGGGMVIASPGDPTVTNCTFRGNSAMFGGGISASTGCSPNVSRCTFTRNLATVHGGGLLSVGDAVVTDCTFSRNFADNSGGGVCIVNASPTVTNCTFRGNVGDLTGGGMSNINEHTFPIVTNCTFTANTADRGGGMYNYNHAQPTVTNCTFNGNAADNGYAMYNERNSIPTVTNCILWGDLGSEIDNDSSTPIVTFSDVQGGTGQPWFGAGCIDADPLFVRADGPDDVPGTADDNLRLLRGSPCIDTGNNDAVMVSTDLDGSPRISHGTVDMGAYEHKWRIYVDAAASGANDGTTWADAYSELDDALADAASGAAEIWVAAAMYRPARQTDPLDPRTATFQLVSGVALYGGFDGSESSLAERAGLFDQTILSGDIGTLGYDSDNSYHVVTASGTDATAVLDGFTITGGNANGSSPHCSGGGMFNDGGSPSVTNCTFTGNAASVDGGGMWNDGGSPSVTHCTFAGNAAFLDGGGMWNWGGSPSVTNCTFIANSTRRGAGAYNFDSSPLFLNCAFIKNTAIDDAIYARRGGAGIYNFYYSDPTLINCTFVGNTGASRGGGIYNHWGSAPTLLNCTFVGNVAGSGGGMANLDGSNPSLTNCTFVGNSAEELGSGIYNYGGSPAVANSILWDDASSEIYNHPLDPPANCIVTYTDVQGGYYGAGNINEDPLFVRFPDPGMDQEWGTDDDDDGDLHLRNGDPHTGEDPSPCVDRGTNSRVPLDTLDLDDDGDTDERIPLDLDGNPRFVADPQWWRQDYQWGHPSADAPVDMGAYELFPDCNKDTTPDWVAPDDCNQNYAPDECEIDETSEPEGSFFCPVDCVDGCAPCAPDCNRNGTPDECEIHESSTAPGGPFFCESDCAPDCNMNGTPDQCEIDQSSTAPGGPFFCPADCAPDCNINGTPDQCEIDENSTAAGGPFFCRIDCAPDCNNNGIPEECDAASFRLELDEITGRRASFREGVGYDFYQNMIAAYGRPWRPDSGHSPDLLGEPGPDPAETLRALYIAPLCWEFKWPIFRRLINELTAFETLAGNEAFADAMDPTVGTMAGYDPADLFAFDGVPGVGSLLDEELALLRGRQVADPSVDDPGTYPCFDDPQNPEESFCAAVYNRLPPNCGGPSSVAYESNYDVSSNYVAVRDECPQGHGDAYGYYLSATKLALDAFRGDPAVIPEGDEIARNLISCQSQAECAEQMQPDVGGSVSVPYEQVRRMAGAMAARGRAAIRIVDLTFRRDYRDDPENPQAGQALEDSDRQRAWGTADWARRAGLGAYLDWAIVNQLLPPDDGQGDALDDVHRGSVQDIGELAAAVTEMQERADTAGAGLNPLGLVQNVVPFGINASLLGPDSGSSHYEQICNAAVGALHNARTILLWANESAQRIREQGQDQATFAEQVQDRESDFNNRLIELFGCPFPEDPADNDLDPQTDDGVEADLYPDLVNFMMDQDSARRLGWETPRPAPGEIQLAVSELKIAALRLQEADGALAALRAEIDDLVRFIEFRTQMAAEAQGIFIQAGDELMTLEDRLREINSTSGWAKMLGGIGGLTQGVIGCSAGEAKSCATGIGSFIGCTVGAALEAAGSGGEDEYDIEKERIRINTWRDAELRGIDDRVEIQRERLRLQSLIRQTPQLLVNLGVARESAGQALGRLHAAIQRGKRLVEERDRVRSVQRDQLVEYRWKDLSFRVFRNNSLQQYGAFFDLAARYVMLATRAFAYEYNDRDAANNLLERIHRERRLGNDSGTTGGLRGIIFDLDNLATVNNFNSPLQTVGQRTFGLCENLCGLGATQQRDFRAWLESKIVQRLEDLPAMQDYAQLSVANHYGPAIVVPFFTEVAGNNFFGNGPEPPYNNTNFPISLNAKVRNFAIRFDGVDPAPLGIDPKGGYVYVFLVPLGESVLREDTNQSPVEANPPRPWAVVDQWLPAPPLVTTLVVEDRDYNPWVSTGHSGGNYLNAIKRFQETEAQVDLGQELVFNTRLAGRSCWNTQWLLVIPGGQWAGTDPADIHAALMKFIYGGTGDPSADEGITDIRIIIQAYSH